MVTIDCPPQILVVKDNRKGLILNAGHPAISPNAGNTAGEHCTGT